MKNSWLLDEDQTTKILPKSIKYGPKSNWNEAQPLSLGLNGFIDRWLMQIRLRSHIQMFLQFGLPPIR